MKSNKIWVGKSSEFYNTPMKSWLEKNTIEMYSTHNKGKSVIAERFLRTLNIKNKIYKYIISKPKKVYIDKLDHIVNKYNNKYHSTTKVKPVDGKSSTHINSSKEITYASSDLKGKEIVRTLYKNKSKRI